MKRLENTESKGAKVALRAGLAGLRVRLFLLVLVAVVPSFVLLFYGAAEQRRLATLDAQEDALRLARSVAAHQEQLVEGARELLVTLTQLSSVRNRDPIACSNSLAGLLQEYPLYENLGVADRNGDIVCTAIPSQSQVNLADRAFFQQTLQKRGFAVGEYLVARISGKAVFSFGYPVLDEAGQVQAVVFTGIDLSWLSNYLAEAELPVGSTLCVVDRNGTILARYPDPKQWVGQSLPLPMTQELASRKESIGESTGSDGVTRLDAFVPLGNASVPDAYVRVGIPKSVALAEADRTLISSLTALAVVAALVFGAAWIGADRLILRQMDVLMQTTRQLSAGNLRVRTGLRYDGGEVSQLAQAFDQMADALERREGEQKRAQEQIERQTRRAEALARIAGRLNSQLEFESVVSAVCEETARALNVPAASVNLLNEKGDLLCYAGGYGLPAEFGELFHEVPRAWFDQATERTGSVIVPQDFSCASKLASGRSDAVANVRTVAAAAMRREGQLVGSLNVFAFDQRALSEDEIMLLRGIADEAALAIANSRLYSALRQQERGRAKLLHQVITAQEDERMRIARELHDETGQSISALIVGLDVLRMIVNEGAGQVDEHIEALKSIAGGMLDGVHRLIADLRPSLLDDLGLVPAIAWYGEKRLNPLGIQLHLEDGNLKERLPRTMETALFRIVQEGMTNVVRHAHATAVTVHLGRQDNDLTLEIVDNGQGFDPDSMNLNDPAGKGVGLRGMRERTTLLGGVFHLQSAPGHGTKIQVRVPIPMKEGVHG